MSRATAALFAAAVLAGWSAIAASGGSETANTLNKAAVEWVWSDREEEPAEPWVFLVDAGGTVIERWDNVAPERSLTEAGQAVVEATA